jgi:polar amino acid transport system substrate-binding protein
MSVVPTEIVEDLAPTDVLRATVTVGNRLLVQGPPEEPTGVTVDIAHELGARLGIPVELVRCRSVPDALEATRSGQADICFMGIDPAREVEIAFTTPYVVVESVYVVPRDSSIAAVADVDRAGVRIGVLRNSSQDLYLSRTIRHASLVRGDSGVDVLREQGLEAAAGPRHVLTGFVTDNPGFRLVEGQFLQVRQAVGTTRARSSKTVEFLTSVIEELKARGFIADAIRRANSPDLTVAPAG